MAVLWIWKVFKKKKTKDNRKTRNRIVWVLIILNEYFHFFTKNRAKRILERKYCELTVDLWADFRSVPGSEKRKFLISSMQIKNEKKSFFFTECKFHVQVPDNRDLGHGSRMRLIYCLLHDFSHSLYREIINFFFLHAGFRLFVVVFNIVYSSTVHDVLHLIDVRFFPRAVVVQSFVHSNVVCWGLYERKCWREDGDVGDAILIGSQATWLNSLSISYEQFHDIFLYFSHLHRLTERNDQMLLSFVFCLTFFTSTFTATVRLGHTRSPLLFGLTALASNTSNRSVMHTNAYMHDLKSVGRAQSVRCLPVAARREKQTNKKKTRQWWLDHDI